MKIFHSGQPIDLRESSHLNSQPLNLDSLISRPSLAAPSMQLVYSYGEYASSRDSDISIAADLYTGDLVYIIASHELSGSEPAPFLTVASGVSTSEGVGTLITLSTSESGRNFVYKIWGTKLENDYMGGSHAEFQLIQNDGAVGYGFDVLVFRPTNVPNGLTIGHSTTSSMPFNDDLEGVILAPAPTLVLATVHQDSSQATATPTGTDNWVWAGGGSTLQRTAYSFGNITGESQFYLHLDGAALYSLYMVEIPLS